MDKRVTLLCILLNYIVGSQQQSTPNDDHYWAGVVEFSFKERSVDSESPVVYTARNLEQYKQIINSTEADPVDIIVFPEYGLSAVETASFVPNPVDLIAPCNNLEYEAVVRDLSCLARDRQKYLVVNLVEKALCPEEWERRPCAPNGLYHFNANVVFDRNGRVIARYRKFNLFGEAGINVTSWADLTHFETDFGVKFGTFICFDLMFEQPALQLVRSGVTDFIFSTMWFSELPFLTAAQIQQAWAYTNNVNFLAAGASFPEVGSTGTGVFAGKRGRIVAVMNHNADSKLYVAQVPKISRPQATISRQPVIRYTPAEMSNLKLKRDHIDGYRTSNLPLNVSSHQESLCQGSLCCNFTIDYTVTLPADVNQQYYRYMLAVSEGKRTFDGFADGMITTCAIFACAGEDQKSCSTRFEDPSKVVEAVRFNTIEIVGAFPGSSDVFLLPNSVDTSILPLEVDEIEYSERLFTQDGELYKQIQYNLVKPRSDLFTFAIWGRKFVHQNSSAQATIINGLEPSRDEL
ncbi:vanin-like protein 1 isoform X2 [Ochlerotatus camptorhynchus]|uniref:vanin-like protein 1 isoform X2 n=1 Tax=Ochlerotatus camptorhynchus TaxID=644619 RepID=UPI0031DDD07E